MATVEELCGEYPSNFEKIDIISNPKYVFENDPNFQTRQLYDIESNVISVNSFLECENYVSGGWDYQPTYTSEVMLQNNLIFILIFLIVVSFFKKKIFRFK